MSGSRLVRRVASRATVAMLATTVGCVTSGARGVPAGSVSSAPVAGAPSTILARGEALEEARRRVRANDPALRAAHAKLLADADSALAMAPISVVQKQRTPPSGDKHDFMSLAPYWWPDSTKPGGIPFVRRDGLMNPESRTDHDGIRFQKMQDAVEALALAYYFTGDAKYADRAAHLLHVFFVDPATRMNPNLRFAQAVLGVNEGRGIGIIDLRVVPQLVDALRLLDRAPSWPAADRAAIASWCRDYLAWLVTSANGRDEMSQENNHGTWYDAQVAALALYVGDSAEARRTLERAVRRLDVQVAPDGRQPLELARTRPMHYSLFNLDAFTQLAEMGRHVGMDLWGHGTPAGAGLRAALDFVAPYADSTVVWPAPEVTPVERDLFVYPIVRAGPTRDPVLARALAALPSELLRTHRSRLLYPDAVAAEGASLDSLADRALRYAAAQLRRSAESLDPAEGYPRSTRRDGAWVQRGATAWTSGFFAGELWYMYELTRDAYWRRQAERWTTGLEPMKDVTTTHDLGFVLFDSFGHGYRLTGDARYRDVVLQGSRTLARRFSPTVGAIKSWDTERVADARRGWAYPVIIDNMMNLEMLFWAARNGGGPSLRDVAERHALTSLAAHLRLDGSTAHVALFDPHTGALERRVTWQGYADTSAWARGQAWAIYGFTVAYRETGRPELLAGARRAADFFLAHLPADGVPYWDLRHPAIPSVERDASAAAIAAAGLLELAERGTPADRPRYRAAAERILKSLCTSYLTVGTPSAAILQHSVGNAPQHDEVDVGIVYADYYFVEALLRWRGGGIPGRPVLPRAERSGGS